jgi:hypothetical protein
LVVALLFALPELIASSADIAIVMLLSMLPLDLQAGVVFESV